MDLLEPTGDEVLHDAHRLVSTVRSGDNVIFNLLHAVFVINKWKVRLEAKLQEKEMINSKLTKEMSDVTLLYKQTLVYLLRKSLGENLQSFRSLTPVKVVPILNCAGIFEVADPKVVMLVLS
ncbi:hypothetical protein DAPPUDRAFT_242060 [Daphnia pulex]|uniref:Uncharacterized protein n=1 Tax=Daphnia pulex TaxID=6669 RepID=E9GFS3_DAPPU|nr:hypothetical protein DAPPUDRAFT_242060 [Daphnia pulex]|eukprot:EFX81761.1 hypothetical protein DAPPUDRAFT_242060 [Daphnia pulex]